MQNFDFLAIGDTVIDAFIRLTDAEIVTAKDGHTQLLGVRYGDKVPFESVEICNAVGNAANAAVSASRLGLKSAILTYLGNDQHGTDCKNEFEKNGVSLDLVRTEDGKTTNYHYVLWYDVDRTILIKHEAFDYELGDIGTPKWIYLSSLGEHSAHMYEAIAAYLETHPFSI
jgi:sugar/nucleoside kinase (ribokinase family)